MPRNGRPKTRIGISPDPEVLDWIDEHRGPGRRFASRTHAFEAGILCLAEQMRQEQGSAART